MADLLVVDDDHSTTEALAELLGMEGHVVRVARNGIEGLRLVAERRPDLVICDVDMHGLDGPGMLRRVHAQNHGSRKVPFVMVSGAPDLSRVAGELDAYHLVKPVSLDHLLAVIARALCERNSDGSPPPAA